MTRRMVFLLAALTLPPWLCGKPTQTQEVQVQEGRSKDAIVVPLVPEGMRKRLKREWCFLVVRDPENLSKAGFLCLLGSADVTPETLLCDAVFCTSLECAMAIGTNSGLSLASYQDRPSLTPAIVGSLEAVPAQLLEHQLQMVMRRSKTGIARQ